MRFCLRKMKRNIALCSLAALLLLMSGCGAKESGSTADAKGVTVVAREYLYGVDAEGLEIPDVVGLGQGKVFAWISAAS